MKSARPPSIYDRLGGAKAIELMISSFYTRILSDSLLSPLFQHITIDDLHTMQRSFLTWVTGGPSNRAGRHLMPVNDSSSFTQEHFSHFTKHLLDTLAAFGLSESEAREVAARIREHMDELISVPA